MHMDIFSFSQIDKKNAKHIYIKDAKGNVRGYSKEKEPGRQCAQRFLPKYNNPTYLRLRRKVAAKNDVDLDAECVETLGDLSEINQKSYPFLPIYRKERKIVDYLVETEKLTINVASI